MKLFKVEQGSIKETFNRIRGDTNEPGIILAEEILKTEKQDDNN